MRCVARSRSSAPEAQVQLAGEVTARYPHAHGAPLHARSPQAIGIVEPSAITSGNKCGYAFCGDCGTPIYS